MRTFVLLILAGMLLSVMPQTIHAQEEAAWEEILDIVSGKVETIDLTANVLNITDAEAQKQEFKLDPNLTTVWDDTADEEKELADLEAGKEVVVEFRVDEDGTKVASWIDIIAVEEELPEPPVEKAE